MNTTDIERFWNRVNKTSNPNGCWEWIGSSKHPFGYGRFGYGKKKDLAHRISYNLHNTPLKKGECVLHQCDNPRCVNPSHLKAGTRKENADERVQRNRGLKGSAVPGSILTEQQVLEIRSSNKSAKELAVLYGVGQANIYLILSGKTWRHI